MLLLLCFEYECGRWSVLMIIAPWRYWSCVLRRTRRRSCFAWSTSAVWTPRCVKKFGLSCSVITSLEWQTLREIRFVTSTVVALLLQQLFFWTTDSRPRPLQVDEQVRVCYQQTMCEWLRCEEVVRQREKEQHAAALAKCSSGASMDSSSQKMMHHDSTISNEVKQWHTLRSRVKFPSTIKLVTLAVLHLEKTPYICRAL